MPRSTRRYRKTLPLTVLHDGARVMGKLENASMGGIQFRALIRAGAETVVDIHALGSQVQVEIRWANGDMFGGRFVGETTKGDLNRFLYKLLRGYFQPHSARLHGFTEMGRPAAGPPVAPLRAGSLPQGPSRTG